MRYTATTETLLRGDTQLALHKWVPQKVQAVLFYIHGKQSHAGWLFETGPELAAQGIAVCVLDRRGSGVSGGLRGDMPSLTVLLDDYLNALQQVRRQFPDLPLTLMGQSFGGAVLAGLLSRDCLGVKYDAVLFCASALGKCHELFDKKAMADLCANRSLERQLINLADTDYTVNRAYLKFMQEDSYCQRELTNRARAVYVELELQYMHAENYIKVPACYVYPENDPIVNIKQALNVFAQMSGDNGQVLQLPGDRHYLEFSQCRQQFLCWLAQYVLTAGFGGK